MSETTTSSPKPSVIERLAEALFIKMSEGSGFSGLDGTGTWQTATSEEAKAKWCRVVGAPLQMLVTILREMPEELCVAIRKRIDTDIEAAIAKPLAQALVNAVADYLDQQAGKQ